MAKVCLGILDGFVGKVGTVIGSFWKGIPVMRAYKRVVTQRNTESQQLVRTRFAAIGSLAGAFLSAIRIGLKEVARKQRLTEGDVFVQRNWEHVHADTPGSASIDYSELQIADGHLPEASFGAPSFTNPLEVDVSMSSTTDMIGADADDEVYLFVYSTEAGAGMLGTTAKRSDNQVKANVPAYWNGHRVHVWGFAKGAGTQNAGTLSKSRYLGSGTIS